MNEPEKLIVETDTITASRVRQVVYFPSNEEKLPLLLGLLSRADAKRTMVFVNTKAWVERVGRALEKAHYRVGVLSGDVPQKKRQSLLAKFQRAELEILVATDVAARGLHIDAVSHVYNFDLPFDAEDYVHRIGRTARLGAEGDAISFACEIYAQSLPEIEAFIEQKIPVESVTAELLQAVPRTPREPVASADGEANESIADIFREARAEAAASGRGPKSGGRGGRSGGGSRSGPRRPEGEKRPPRREERPASAAPAKPAADAPRPPRDANTEPAPRREGEAPRRRRRRGPRPEGSAPAKNPAVPATSRSPAAMAPASNGTAPKKPSLLGRLANRVKSLISPSKP